MVEQIDVLHEVDVLYEGQTHLFRFPVKCPGFDAREVEREFAVRYKARFDIDLPNIRVVLSNLRTTVFGRRRKTVDQAPTARAVYFNGIWEETKIYRRDSLASGAAIEGPAVIEQMDTTLVVEPGSHARVDRLGNIVVEIVRHP